MMPHHATSFLVTAFSSLPNAECKAAFDKALTSARHEHTQVMVACLGLLRDSEGLHHERASRFLDDRYLYVYPMFKAFDGVDLTNLKDWMIGSSAPPTASLPILGQAAQKIGSAWNLEDVNRYREEYLGARAMVQSLPEAAIAQIFLDVAVLADYRHASVSQEAKANLEAMKEGGEEIRRLLAPLYNKR